MKLSVFLLPFVLFISTFSLDKLTSPGNSNQKLSVSEKRFLVKIAEVRTINWQEGELALKHSGNLSIKKYSEVLLQDQERLMNEVRKLAASKGFTLPESCSDIRKKDIELKPETGKEFDDEFIKMMVINNRRDVKYFKMALELKDPDIRMFASKYLPLIESHLDGAKALRQ